MYISSHPIHRSLLQRCNDRRLVYLNRTFQVSSNLLLAVNVEIQLLTELSVCWDGPTKTLDLSSIRFLYGSFKSVLLVMEFMDLLRYLDSRLGDNLGSRSRGKRPRPTQPNLACESLSTIMRFLVLEDLLHWPNNDADRISYFLWRQHGQNANKSTPKKVATFSAIRCRSPY